MSTWIITGIVSASVTLGEYEASTKEEAIALAEKSRDVNWNPSVCHQCSHNIDIGDIYEVIAEESEKAE